MVSSFNFLTAKDFFYFELAPMLQKVLSLGRVHCIALRRLKFRDSIKLLEISQPSTSSKSCLETTNTSFFRDKAQVNSISIELYGTSKILVPCCDIA